MSNIEDNRALCVGVSKSLDDYYNKVYDRNLNPNYEQEFISTGFYDEDMLSENEREARWS